LDPSKKTGLGSSAALIVSFIAATYKITGLLSAENLELVHRDAQLLNAFVQEKVGSGFDIACSVYGSQVYQRFTNVKELTEVVSRMQ
jgi:phosphomevalonate kinase